MVETVKLETLVQRGLYNQYFMNLIHPNYDFQKLLAEVHPVTSESRLRLPVTRDATMLQVTDFCPSTIFLWNKL